MHDETEEYIMTLLLQMGKIAKDRQAGYLSFFVLLMSEYKFLKSV